MNTSYGPLEIIVAGVGESPPNFKDSWVERDAVQAELLERLDRNSVTEILAGGGFGKSWLAAWAFDTLTDTFDKRLWVNFRRELWQSYGFDRFARWVLQEIGFPQKDPTAQEDLLLRELLYRLNDQNRPVKALVVMDNLESLRQAADWHWFEQFLQTWATQGQGSRVLVTTRPAVVTVAPLELGGLSETEGVTFLQREGLTGNCFPQLIELASGHPLLLKLAATWVRQTAGAAVDERAIAFFRHLFEPYRDTPASLAEARVEPIFDQVFAALPETWQDLLLRVSVYRVPFNLAMAQAMVEAVTAADLQTLVERALLVAEGERFTLHPLMAELVRGQVSEAVRGQTHGQAMTYYLVHPHPWDGTLASCQAELEAFHHACELGQYNLAYQALNHCVDLLYRVGYWRNLLPFYQRLSQQWQAAGETEIQNLGWAWTWLGNLYRHLGDAQGAITAHQQAQVLFKSLNFDEGQAASLSNLGVTYHGLGNYQKALELFQQSFDIMRKVGDCRGEAAALSHLGIACQTLGHYQRALELHQQSLDMKRKLGDREGEAVSLGNLGSVCHSLGQYRRAIKFHQQWLDISRETGNRQDQANALGNLGNTCCSIREYQRAIEFHQKSLDISQEIEDRQNEANSLGNIGNVYRCLEQYRRAIELYQQSLNIAEDRGYLPGKAICLGGLGIAYQSLGQYQKAIESYQKSIDIKRDIGDPAGEAFSLWSLANLYQQRGRLKHAMHHRHQAYRIWHKMQLPLAAAPFPALTKSTISC